MKKTLYLLRHAKAEIGGAAQQDHERALNNQGIEACTVMGEYLKNQHVAPQQILCSAALRTRATWDLISQSYPNSFPVVYTEKLYLATANEIVNQLALLPDEVSSALVVGHNPGIQQLCLTVAHKGDDAMLDKLAFKYPTCTFAALSLGDIAWKDTARASGTLLAFASPRMITG